MDTQASNCIDIVVRHHAEKKSSASEEEKDGLALSVSVRFRQRIKKEQRVNSTLLFLC